MNLALSFFQKELHEVTIEDLETFFNEEQEETSTLEFKSGDVPLEKLHGEVCAFLNTEGGLLLIGTPREIEVDKRRICTGKLTSCTSIKSEHSLMQSLATNISPAPAGLKCKALPYGGGYLYVLEVPQSMHPPHQVSREGKYYIRLDKEAKAAPHGIVEALFQKRQKPDLSIKSTISTISGGVLKKTLFQFAILNLSSVSADKVSFMISISCRYYIYSHNSRHSKLYIENDGLIIRGGVKGSVVVKGLQIKEEITIDLLSKYSLIDCTAWAKDSDLFHCVTLYDNTSFKAVSSYANNKDSEEVRQKLYGQYKKLKGE
jgi:hypothetical protein